jgi:signal transduction histidine kinase/CheY-like chemotaxis protein
VLRSHGVQLTEVFAEVRGVGAETFAEHVPVGSSPLLGTATFNVVGLVPVLTGIVCGALLVLALWRRRTGLGSRAESGRKRQVESLTNTVTDLRLRDEASQVMAKKMERFLATLAHELRGPLSPLLIATEQLCEPRTDERRSRQLAGIASRQVKQLQRLVDDLCDLNRVNHGHLSVRRSEIELARVIEQATEAVEPLVEAKGQRLSIRISDEAFPVSGDFARLVQVFFNLLTNASRYSDNGKAIGVDVARVGARVAVTVSDSGIGISRENLLNIFDLFRQVAPLSENSEEGFGVGLAVVQELVRLHDGRIEATSEGLGRGSSFRVLLPLMSVVSTAVASGRPDSLLTSGGAQRDARGELRVVRSVIVDDDADSAESLALALKEFGVDVRTAYDGLDGLSAVADFEPHVVFLDLSLPRMSGLEVARKIRTTDQGKALRLVALTGSGSASDRRECLESGFDAHLTKPLELSAAS